MREWQRLTMLSVFFHQCNVRLPLWLERRLAPVMMMTPRLCGIHHSVVVSEQDSNWSSQPHFSPYLRVLISPPSPTRRR